MFEDFDDFKPTYFLNFSEELHENMNLFETNNPTLKRVMYGRIYYATFLYLREWLKQNTNYHSTHRDHTVIPNYITAHGPFNELHNLEISTDFRHLKKLRQQSDYNITLPEKETNEYDNWIWDSVENAFKISCNIIKSFDDIAK